MYMAANLPGESDEERRPGIHGITSHTHSTPTTAGGSEPFYQGNIFCSGAGVGVIDGLKVLTCVLRACYANLCFSSDNQ